MAEASLQEVPRPSWVQRYLAVAIVAYFWFIVMNFPSHARSLGEFGERLFDVALRALIHAALWIVCLGTATWHAIQGQGFDFGRFVLF